VKSPRSYCPINLSLEIFGDSWTLLVLRDIVFGGKRHFRELLQSQEGIASNILADRLATLLAHGVVTKRDDPTHKQKAIYSLTEKGIALVPVLAQIGIWGRHNVPAFDRADAETKAVNRMLERGGPELWGKMMDDLRAVHLTTSRAAKRSVPRSPRRRARRR
jgi:DNA-binding HxlR family transcriptional regulator